MLSANDFYRLMFWTVYAVILLLPFCLLLAAIRWGNLKASEEGTPVDQEVHLARWCAFLAASTPVLQLLLSLAPVQLTRDVSAYLVLGLPLCAFCSGLLSIVLFLVFARGRERIAGPCAALLACTVGTLGFFGGMVAA